MSKDEAYVRNAADPKQVKAAGRKEKRDRELELADARAVLETEAGRRLVWRILGYCRWGSDIWAPGDVIHFNAGIQHVGTWLAAEVNAADEEKFFLMMRESKARKAKNQLEALATRTRAVTGDDTDDNESD